MVGMRPVYAVLPLLVLSFSSVFGPSGSSQTANCVSVHVLNSKNGKPVRGVLIDFVINRSEYPYKAYAPINIGKSDKQGIATYCIPEPLPRSFTLRFYDFIGRDSEEVFDTETVLKYGVVTKNSLNRRKSNFNHSPEPGEVVIFGQHSSFVVARPLAWTLAIGAK
jgi:hypothetical protein